MQIDEAAIPPEAGRLALGVQQWRDICTETVGLLTRLIAADSSNPPGNEVQVAGVLEEYLLRTGIDCRRCGGLPDRPSIVARLRGQHPGPRIMLLSHTDVVPADEREWSVPPFSGLVKDGYVWGRGALDMKNQVAAHAVALARLARSRRSLRGEVILVAASDEEAGGSVGAEWLVDHLHSEMRCDYLITEPVVPSRRIDGRLLLPLVIGEKTVAHYRVRVVGDSCHASIPLHEGNCITRLGRLLTRLEEVPPSVSISPEVREFIGAVVSDQELAERLVNPSTLHDGLTELRGRDLRLAQEVEALTCTTCSPTSMISEALAPNAVPRRASAYIDCRLPLGQKPSRVESLMRRAFGGTEDYWSLERVAVIDGSISRNWGSLHAPINEVMNTMAPGSQVLAVPSTAASDASTFRHAFPDIVAVGFCPSFPRSDGIAEGELHGIDERVRVDDVGLQTAFFEAMLARVLRSSDVEVASGN